MVNAPHKLARKPSYLYLEGVNARRLTTIPLHKSDDIPACVLLVVDIWDQDRLLSARIFYCPHQLDYI